MNCFRKELDGPKSSAFSSDDWLYKSDYCRFYREKLGIESVKLGENSLELVCAVLKVSFDDINFELWKRDLFSFVNCNG